MITNELIDQATDRGALGGGAVAILGGVTFNEWMAIIGVIIAAASFGVNLWHKRAMVRVEKERLKLERERE